MTTDTIKKHPWHLVDPSPWPFLGAACALGMALGGILFMQTGILWGFIAGVVAMMMVTVLWWRDVIREAEHQGHHSEAVQTGLRIGMLLFITSEVMFFFAFFWAFYHSSLPLLNLVAGPWPPKGIVTLNAWEIPFLNTLILLTSSLTVTIAHHALIEGERAKVVRWDRHYGVARYCFPRFSGG